MQWRMSMLMVSNALSIAFGGLLALAIAGIKTNNGYKPWRWVFIIEGCFTAGVTILAYLFMSDWPSTVKWLTPAEKEILANKSEQSWNVCGRFALLTTSSQSTGYRRTNG